MCHSLRLGLRVKGRLRWSGLRLRLDMGLLLRVWVRWQILGLTWRWWLLWLQGSLCLLLWCLRIVRWPRAVLRRIWLRVRRLDMWLWSLLHLL
jgi:hypothetical protein